MMIAIARSRACFFASCVGWVKLSATQQSYSCGWAKLSATQQSYEKCWVSFLNPTYNFMEQLN